MPEIIKTSISSIADTYDVNGQWLPRGNYYFSVINMDRGKITGKLSERAFSTEYVFNYKTVIEMMSVAQARLARRANITHENMPSVLSPTPSHDYPTNMVVNRSNTSLPTIARSIRSEVLTPPMCTICLQTIENREKILRCMHIFHEHCINPWILRHRNCPICRTSTVRERTINTNYTRDLQTRIRSLPNRYNRIPRIRPRRQPADRNRIYRESVARLIG